MVALGTLSVLVLRKFVGMSVRICAFCDFLFLGGVVGVAVAVCAWWGEIHH